MDPPGLLAGHHRIREDLRVKARRQRNAVQQGGAAAEFVQCAPVGFGDNDLVPWLSVDLDDGDGVLVEPASVKRQAGQDRAFITNEAPQRFDWAAPRFPDSGFRVLLRCEL